MEFEQELETVDMEVNDLIQQANKGGDMSNIKSAASGERLLCPLVMSPCAAFQMPFKSRYVSNVSIAGSKLGFELSVDATATLGSLSVQRKFSSENPFNSGGLGGVYPILGGLLWLASGNVTDFSQHLQ